MKTLIYFSLIAIVFPGLSAAQDLNFHERNLKHKPHLLLAVNTGQVPITKSDSILQRAEQKFYELSGSAKSTAVLQKSSDELFKVDSIKTEQIHVKLQYDEAGNNTVTERWFYNTFTGNLQTLFRFVREFDSGNQVSENRISVDVETFEEKPLSRLEYTYSSEGLLLTEKRLTWEDGAETPEPQWLINFTANEDGLLESMTRCNYVDGDEDQCINSSNTVYSYNEAQLETERIISNWDGDTEEWVWTARWLSTYEENLLMLEERFAWTGESWQVTGQNIFEYDESGNEVYYEQQFYSVADEVWNPEWRSLIEYNAEGLPIETLSQSWFQPAQEWRNWSKGLLIYDAAGNTTDGEFLFWNNNQGEWIDNETFVVEYDLNVPEVNVLPTIQNTFDFGFIHENKILQYSILYNPEDKGPGDEFRTYYYSPITILNAPAHKGPELSLYPNPVRDELFIDFGGMALPAMITLHDLQGRVVLQKQLNNSGSVSVGKLSQGIYVYTLQGTEIYQSGKLVKVE